MTLALNYQQSNWLVNWNWLPCCLLPYFKSNLALIVLKNYCCGGIAKQTRIILEQCIFCYCTSRQVIDFLIAVSNMLCLSTFRLMWWLTWYEEDFDARHKKSFMTAASRWTVLQRFVNRICSRCGAEILWLLLVVIKQNGRKSKLLRGRVQQGQGFHSQEEEVA